MSLAAQVAKVSASVETATRANEFAKLAQYVLAHDGRISEAAASARHSTRDGNLGPKLADIVKGAAGGSVSREHLKAAVAAGTLAGSALADYAIISTGFVNSLVNVSCFDTMISSMVPVPLGVGTVGAVSVGATAYSLAEGSAKPIARLTIGSQLMNPQKAHCIIVITQELARSAFIGATQLIQTELKNAVAVATDTAFRDRAHVRHYAAHLHRQYR